MNFWPRFVRDIRGATMTLSMAQMGAYDRFLDYYYEEEKPLPADLDECYRIAGATSKQDRADVQKVLARYFVLSESGYHQEKVEQEIALGHKRIEAAKANGKKGGRPTGSGKKPTGFPVGSPEGTQGEPSGEAPHPQQILSVPIGTGAGAPRTRGLDGQSVSSKDVVFALGVPLLIAASIDEGKARKFLGHLCKQAGDAATAEALQACAIAQPVEPISWLQARIQPKPTNGKHAGFASKNYREGVTEDGSFA